MSYIWEKFNIKTFAAETIVYRDGVYCPELSTLKNDTISQKYDLPVHIIYVGEISDENNLNINIAADSRPVFLTVKIKNKKPAFFNIFVKNTGKNSELRGHVILENQDRLNVNILAEHLSANTGILIHTKLLAHENSVSKLSGLAKIYSGCPECVSDISFAALKDENARIEFLPAQRIASVPQSADHSAAIYAPRPIQIQYLRNAGLSGAEANNLMRDAFINNNPLF